MWPTGFHVFPFDESNTNDQDVLINAMKQRLLSYVRLFDEIRNTNYTFESISSGKIHQKWKILI